MKIWRHVIVNAHCTWLHGDPRGFRSRRHRIHSSGDYKNPPPVGEHAGLWRYQKERSADPVQFNLSMRCQIVCEVVGKLTKLDHRVIACSCSAEHLHALCELPRLKREARLEVGKAKQKASHALAQIPGTIWASGGSLDPIRDEAHLRNTYQYIRSKQEAGTVVWSHRDDEDWIRDPSIGVVVMGSRKMRERRFDLL